MPQRQRFSNQRKARQATPTPPSLAERQAKYREKKPVIVYGKPFVVMEDTEKRTFIYGKGGWVRDTRTIADYKLDCKVTELPQKINRMTRFEVRCPIGTEA